VAAVKLLIIVQVQPISCVFLIKILCFIVKASSFIEPLREIIAEECYSDVRIKCSLNQGNPHRLIIN